MAQRRFLGVVVGMFGMLGMFGCASQQDGGETGRALNDDNVGGLVGECVADVCKDGGPFFVDGFPDSTTFSAIQGYVFEACWRDQCWTGQHFMNMVHASGAAIPTVGSGAALPARWPGIYFALSENSPGKFALATYWEARSPDFEHADGDAFSYSVRDSAGNQLFGRQGTVRWEIVEQNPFCPPPPQGVCTRAVVL